MNNNENNNQINNGSLENTSLNNNQINGTNTNVSYPETNVSESINFDNNGVNNKQLSNIDTSANINNGYAEPSVQMSNVTSMNNNSNNNVNSSEITFDGSSTQEVPTFQTNDSVNIIQAGVDDVENNMDTASNNDTINGQNDESANVIKAQVDIQNSVQNTFNVNSNSTNKIDNVTNQQSVAQEPVNLSNSFKTGIVTDNSNANFNSVDEQCQNNFPNQVNSKAFNNVISNDINQNNNAVDVGQVQANNQDTSINIVQNNTDSNSQAMENKVEQSSDEELISVYVGVKYDKIKNGKFNFWAFLFGPIYLAYRKMFWYGIFLCVIETVLTNFVKIGFWFVLVLRIVLALYINKFYLQDANKKINKIKSENATVSKDALIMASKLSGGVSKELLTLSMYVAGTIATIALIISMITGTVNFFKNILGNVNWSTSDKNDDTSNNNTSNNGDLENDNDPDENYTFDGSISYNTSVNINNTFNITVPSGFEEDSFWGSSDYHLDYELNGTQVFGDCKFEFYSPKGYNSAEGLANAMQKYYVKNNSETSLITTKSNNINWYNFSNVDSFSTNYYYLMSNDNKVYVVSYESGKDNLDICNSYKDSIIGSISLK